MELLDEKTQSIIDGLIDNAYEFSQNGDYDKSFELLKKAWDSYPNPKENWTEAYNTAKYIFEDYMILKKWDEAKEWLEKLNEINNAFRAIDENAAHTEDLNFNTGKYCYETGNFEEAYKKFKETVRQSGKNHYRYFADEDKKYLEFYKTQKKLEDKNS